MILDHAIRYYKTIAIYQPVINGVGGNLVAIYASRLSTALHRTGDLGAWAFWSPTKFYLYPVQAFFGKNSKLKKNIYIFMIYEPI